MNARILAATLMLATGAPALAANLVVDGSFESGAFSPAWTQFGDTSFTGVVSGVFIEAPTDGDFQAVFGPVDGIGGISQTILTGAGTYTVTFDLGNSGGTFSSVDFGGINLLSGIGDQLYTSYSFTVTTAANPVLSFSFSNPPSYYSLDNISVDGAIPEPATWALMIGGFGMVGFAARRRRSVVTA